MHFDRQAEPIYSNMTFTLGLHQNRYQGGQSTSCAGRDGPEIGEIGERKGIKKRIRITHIDSHQWRKSIGNGRMIVSNSKLWCKVARVTYRGK